MKTFVNAILVGVVALAMSGAVQATTITYAEARANFVAGAADDTTQTATSNPLGLTDTYGTGYWNYYASSSSNPSTATLGLLTWKTVS